MPQPKDHDPVRAWREQVVLPTYPVGKPDPNPLFLEKRVYQGSSGAVYPLPVIEHLGDAKEDREYEGVFLENEYLKILVLPELGGRVQMALDKTSGYHFVYHNRVIKPALVGLAGPWISGGIEFNWPQHHRPSTFLPLASHIEKHRDGSCTVWCNEVDRLQRTKGLHGLTLHPGRAVLEVRVRLYNRTDVRQSFLWWANPAVPAGDDHQSVFPPDVTHVMDHGKRGVSDFPIATGTYYGVDYAPGTDISRYRNVPVPTSYMAHRSAFDFVASYDHGERAGLLHVADHHLAPGKKQWTWGHGAFGQAWDRHLTDEDGPYVELMCGVFTDNQPDFTWLAPHEEKTFSQFFLPYKGVGVIKNATADAAVGLEVDGRRATVRIYTSREYPGARVELRVGGRVVHTAEFDGCPRSHFEEGLVLGDDVDVSRLGAIVMDAEGQPLVEYTPPSLAPEDAPPSPARAIGPPTEIANAEELYLAGLHLEQYRHATRDPEDYWREGLRRDRGDVRCNEALGLWLYRRGTFVEAEEHLRRAVARSVHHNPNPLSGTAHYHLGLVLEARGKHAEAAEVQHKATWSADARDAAHFALARLACREGEPGEALAHLERCLERNAGHHRARHLKAVLLRLEERHQEAERLTEQTLALDPFQVGVLFEQLLHDETRAARFDKRIGDEARDHLELALDYVAAGLDGRAIAVLERFLARVGEDPELPLVHYHLASVLRRCGRSGEADESLQHAADRSPGLCFPHRVESIPVLREAMERNPGDARAPYYLGCLLYGKRDRDRGIEAWERARDLDPSFPTVWRNLGLAWFNHRGDGAAAWDAYARAFALQPTDGRVLFELDQLAKRLGHDPGERASRLEEHTALVATRDDLRLEHATLLNQLGRHHAALEVLAARPFRPWEGGEGKVPAQYVLALARLARTALAAERYDEALELLERAQEWPTELGEGKLAGHGENDICYLAGLALRGRGDEARARELFERAAEGPVIPAANLYYHDQPPELVYYRGLALRALGREEEALARFAALTEHGRDHLEDEVEIDYFAVSLPDFLVFEDDPQRRHEIHCRYVLALGLHGHGDHGAAAEALARVLALDPSHQGALAVLPGRSGQS